MRLEGIHHVTCITGDAQLNLEFYTGVLGLRLVAKTVNQDDPDVYHLFYSDEEGHPGSDITFFEYRDARRGQAGGGMVHTIVWRVASPQALDFWEQRLAANGVTHARHDGELRFSDPEGLAHALVVSEAKDEPRIARHPEIPAELALQGFDAVRAFSSKPERSRELLENVLNAKSVGESTWELRGAKRGGTITFEPAPGPGRGGAGTVHHVAWGTTVAEHPKWFERLEKHGVPSSPIIDRHYFQSIYFREPSGVLFEIANDAPGFTVDSPVEELGSRIILPPRFEPYRPQIEARLTPLPNPREQWSRTQ